MSAVFLALLCLCGLSSLAAAAGIDPPTTPVIGTMCYLQKRNLVTDTLCNDLTDNNCLLQRVCRESIEGVWPVLSNQRYHPSGKLTILVKQMSFLYKPRDLCFNEGFGSFNAYFNHWMFYKAVPIGSCNVPEDYNIDYGDPNDLDEASLNSLWSRRRRLPRQVTLPIPHNAQDIRVVTDAEALTFFPNDADTDTSRRWYFLGDLNQNFGDAIFSEYDYTSLGTFDREDFSIPYYIQRSDFRTHESGNFVYLYNYQPICGTQTNHWHQTNHMSKNNVYLDGTVTPIYNRVTDEGRNLYSHNADSYPFDADIDVTPSYLTSVQDCGILLSSSDTDFRLSYVEGCIQSKLGYTPVCVNANGTRTCNARIKISSDYYDANINRGQCLFPLPQQAGASVCASVYAAVTGLSPTCGCGQTGIFSTLPVFVGYDYGVATMKRLQIAPSAFSDWLTFAPLYTWQAEKYLSRSYSRQTFCDFIGAAHEAPGFGSVLYEAGIIGFNNTRGYGMREDVGGQYIGTLTIITGDTTDKVQVITVSGARNDDRLSLVDVQYNPHTVVGGVSVDGAGGTRRMAVRGLDQGMAAPRPDNDKRLDNDKVPYSIPRCRITFPWDSTQFPVNSSAYNSYLRSAGSVLQPALTNTYFANQVLGNMFADSIPSDTWVIRSYSTIYTDGVLSENNAGTLDLRNGYVYQFRNDIKGAANRWRPYNTFDPLVDTYDNIEVSSLLPPCACASTSDATLVPGGVLCDAATRVFAQATEFPAAASEKGTYQNAPENCSIAFTDAVDNGDGTISLMQARMYEGTVSFQPATSQRHGRLWYGWQVDGPDVKTVVVGNTTSRSAFYDLNSVSYQFNSPGTYTVKVAISTGNTRLFLRCQQTIVVRPGCPFIYRTQSDTIANVNQTVTLSAIMPDRGITDSEFTWSWNVYKILFKGMTTYSNTSTPLVSLRKMGNSVIGFSSQMMGRFLISLDLVGTSGATTTCKSSFLYNIVVKNSSVSANAVINPDALFIPSICLGGDANFSDSEVASDVKPVEETAFSAARFSINRNIFFTWGSTQAEDQGVTIDTMVMTALGLTGSDVATGAGHSDRIKVSLELAPDQFASPVFQPYFRIFDVVIYVVAGCLGVIALVGGLKVFWQARPWKGKPCCSCGRRKKGTASGPPPNARTAGYSILSSTRTLGGHL